MSERTNEEVIEHIQSLIENQVNPAVANHGGVISFKSYDNGHLIIELSGACSGCAGSTMTLKMGVEGLINHYVPEVKTIEALDDLQSSVAPYYTDSGMFE